MRLVVDVFSRIYVLASLALLTTRQAVWVLIIFATMLEFHAGC